MSTNQPNDEVQSERIEVLLNQTHPFPEGITKKNTDTAILFVKRGNAVIEVDYHRYAIRENQIALIPPSSIFFCASQSDDFAVNSIRIPQRITEEVTAPFEPTFFAFLTEYPVGNITSDDALHLGQMVESLHYVLEDEHHIYKTQIAKLLLQCFFLDLYNHCKGQIAQRITPNVNNQEKLFMNFLTLVHKYAACERDLAFYADKLCISKRYLSALVRKQTGRTPKDFIDTRCTQEIKLMLHNTTDSLQSIALTLHFPDQSFFSRYFKKNAGLTPMAFRSQKG